MEREVSFLFASGFEEVLRLEVVDDETSDGTVDLELLAKDGSSNA